MEVKNKFNTVKIATCNDAHKAEAINQLFERSLLFNRSDDICGIVISKNGEKQFIPISAIPDNVNIEKRDGVVTLVENPVVDSITTKADHNGIDWKSQYKIAETSAERTIILLCTKNIENTTNIGVIGGEILEVGEGVYGHYKISLTPAGSGLLTGATTFEQKAALVRAKYNGTYYYGIKFKSTVPANIYFSGWDHFPEGADAPLYTSYNDADLSEIIELGGGDSGGSSGGGMTEEEKAEINGKIDALQTSVAGKSDTGHKHSASDITSGVLPVANGGTGVTTQADINKAFIGNLNVGVSDVTDGTEFVSSHASDNGFAETTEGALNKPYKRQFIKVWNYIKSKISSVLGLTKDNYGGTADKAITDANGNNIVNTYATKTELEKTTTKSLSLSTVTTGTTKYIKLGTFNWSDSFSFRCKIAGNSFEDNVNLNILSGHSAVASVCGYYSTNVSLTKSIIVKRGNAWNSNFEIYLKITQLTTANIVITVEKTYQNRIAISESTTAPTGTLEEIVFNNVNGMFSSNIDAKKLILENSTDATLSSYGSEPLSIGTGDRQNLGIDRGSIQARNNGAASTMYLNYYGGYVQVGSGRVNGAKLIIQGGTVSSNSYTDINPKIVFNNADSSQNISLTFTDYDAVQAPASLTLNGNQGNEYFIAPCIKASNVMKIPIGAPSSKENGCIWIG